MMGATPKRPTFSKSGLQGATVVSFSLLLSCLSFLALILIFHRRRRRLGRQRDSTQPRSYPLEVDGPSMLQNQHGHPIPRVPSSFHRNGTSHSLACCPNASRGFDILFSSSRRSSSVDRPRSRMLEAAPGFTSCSRGVCYAWRLYSGC